MRTRLVAKCHNWQRPDKGRMRRWAADVIHLCTTFLSYAFHSLKIFFTVNSEILWISNLLAYSYKLEFRHSSCYHYRIYIHMYIYVIQMYKSVFQHIFYKVYA